MISRPSSKPSPGPAASHAVARVAGIQAAKRASDLLPLCHPLLVGAVNVNFEILDEGCEAQVGDVPIRQAASALVVADESTALSDLGEAVAPDRAVPVELEMGKPVRCLQQRRTVPERCIGDLRTVPNLAEADPLGAQ